MSNFSFKPIFGKIVRYEKGIRNAAYAGWKALEAGGSAVDAVESAVVCMEEDPTFNAGMNVFDKKAMGKKCNWRFLIQKSL